MKRAAVFVVVGAAISVFCVILVAQSPPDLVAKVGSAGCMRSTLLQPPGWTTSGVWQASGEGDRLLLADALNHTILTYTSSGRPLGPLSGPLGTAFANLLPSVVRANATTHELLAEIQGGPEDYNRILSLDRHLVPGPLHAVESAKSNHEGSRISGLFEWEPVGGDLVTFSDLEGPRNDWNSGIVRFPLGDPEHFTLLHFVRFHDPERTFYRLGYHYLTSLGNTAFVLRMDSPPGIYKDTDANGAKASTLVPVGNPLSTHEPELNPQLPEFLLRRDFVAVMAAVERSAMPTGIYGWEQDLYVLSRVPDGGGTLWFLRKFAADGRLIAAVRLPVQASHLTPVPGLHSWAFVEKGPVKGYGVQDIKTILFVPSSLLRNMPASPPGAKLTDAPDVCR